MKKILLCFVLFMSAMGDFAQSEENLRFLTSETTTLSNGMKLAWFTNDSRPNLDITFILKFGRRSDPIGKKGLVELLTLNLDQGSLKASANQIALSLEKLGGSFYANEYEDSLSIHLHGLGEDASALLEILSQIVLTPTFPEKEFQAQKSRWLEKHRLITNHPDSFLSRAYRSMSLGLIRGANEARKSVEEMRSLTRQDVADFHIQFFSPSISSIIFVGNAKREWTQKKVVELFGAWKPLAHSTKKNLSSANATKTWDEGLLLVNAPSLYPVQVKIGFNTPKFDLAENKALVLANCILGGAFHSKLNRYVRDQLGLSYSLNSSLNFSQEGGHLSVVSTTRPDNAGALIASILQVLNQMKEGSVTEEDLRAAQDYLGGSFLVTMSQPNVVAARWMEGELFNFESNYLADFIPKLKSVTLEQVKKAIQRNFRTENALIAVVGNAKELKPQLASHRKIKVISPENLP